MAEREIKRRESELWQVERRLAEVEAGFAKNLDLLKRDVLNEEEFNKANVARRDRHEGVSALPGRVRSFLKDLQSLEVRRAKALRQMILATAAVYLDGTIKLAFR